MGRRWGLRGIASVSLIVAVAPSCLDATAVRVKIFTDVPWVSGRSVAVYAESGTSAFSEPVTEVDSPWSATSIGDLVLVPAGDKSAGMRILVTMGVTRPFSQCTPDDPAGCIFVRRRLGFVEHRTLAVPIIAYANCIGVKCDENSTCSSLGQCVSAELDPASCASADGCFLPGESLPTTLTSTAPDGGAPPQTPASDAGTPPPPFPVTSARQIFRRGSSCFVFDNGSAKCWGANQAGQLGLGDTNDRGATAGSMGTALPFIDVGAKTTVTSFGIGYAHICALIYNGGVKCWGSGADSALGLGDFASRGTAPNQMGDNLPYVDLGTGRTAVQLVTGYMFNCALLDNGRVKCWGQNLYGQLGLGDTRSRGGQPGEMGDALPYVDLGNTAPVQELTAQGASVCALFTDGRIKCWGANNAALGLGDGNNRGDNPGEMGDALPYVDVGTGRTVRKVVMGGAACAILDNGGVKCWGQGEFGALGYEDPSARGGAPGQMGDNLPFVNFGTVQTVRSIVSGDGHGCVVFTDGRMKCWGINFFGYLGLGDTANRGNAPDTMGDHLPFVDLGTGRTVVEVSANEAGACALLDNGRVKCWGYNNFGECGLGDTTPHGDGPGEMGDGLPFVDLGN